jgi:hypothetical protein
LGINFIDDLLENSKQETISQISQSFLESPLYADIVYVLINLQAPSRLRKTKARFLKLKVANFCILDHSLYWKDQSGILLSCLLEEEMKKDIKEFHKGDCGGHHYWNTTAHKILREDFYWPIIFFDVYKEVSRCHECQIFDGKRKMHPIPLNHISVEAPFMQMGSLFYRVNSSSISTQHRWILKTT